MVCNGFSPIHQIIQPRLNSNLKYSNFKKLFFVFQLQQRDALGAKLHITVFTKNNLKAKAAKAPTDFVKKLYTPCEDF